MLVDKEPPRTEDMVRRLKERNVAQGLCWDPSCATSKKEVRRQRSYRYCHLPAEPKARRPSPRESGAYVPEMAARVDNDLNLCDGARRCARKLMEYVYRGN